MRALKCRNTLTRKIFIELLQRSRPFALARLRHALLIHAAAPSTAVENLKLRQGAAPQHKKTKYALRRVGVSTRRAGTPTYLEEGCNTGRPQVLIPTSKKCTIPPYKSADLYARYLSWGTYLP